MMIHMRATSDFNIDSWDDEPFDDHGGNTINRVRITKTFTGDLAATSVTAATMAGTAVEGSMAYVAMERITGELQGRQGSFLLHHSAISSATGPQASWLIVPDSGTGELKGLAGSAEIRIDENGAHSITLDYTL